MDWGEVIRNVLLAVLIPIATVIGAMIGSLIREAISKIRNDKLQQLAEKAVLWAEQEFKELDGDEKFSLVYDWLAAKFPYLDSEDIEKAIEAAVASMNIQLKKKK